MRIVHVGLNLWDEIWLMKLCLYLRLIVSDGWNIHHFCFKMVSSLCWLVCAAKEPVNLLKLVHNNVNIVLLWLTINYKYQKINFWLPFLFKTFGFLAISNSRTFGLPICRSTGGMIKFFSDVMVFNEGRGSFTVDFGPLRSYEAFSGIGITLLVLHLESYLGFGKFSLRYFKFWGNLMVLSKF